MSTASGKNRLKWIFLLLLFTTAAGFFVPVPSTGWIGFALKGTLFAIDLFLIAMVLYPPRPKKSYADAQEGEGDLSTSDLELDGSEMRDGAWEGYGKAFRWLSNEYVSVIRKTFSASCAAFYLKNNRGELRIHAADGGEVDPDTLDDDNLVNHVFLQKVPHLAEALPSGSTLPGIPDVDIRSFLGVPLQWGNKTIGVMALGSDTED
ncbi:MAG TPA: GAF domain-containing protein, partial [bacterium]